MVKIIIVGAAGRMGLTLVRCCKRVSNIRLVAAVERTDCQHIGKDIGVLAGVGELGVKLTSELAGVITDGDVVADFSFHNAAPKTAKLVAQAKKALIAGTTGLTKEEERVISEVSRKVPVVYSPNMSLGVNLLFALARRTASVLGIEYDVEIVEVHHKFKKDAPSGTALRLGKMVAQARGQDLSAVAAYGRHGDTGRHTKGQIGIHSIRGGDVVGDHVVSFAGDGERIELTHRATSREAFAMGVLRAALWVVGQPAKLYDMQDVLGLTSSGSEKK